MKISVPPGEMIQHVLSNHNIPQEKLIAESGMREACVRGLLASTHEINQDAANKLAAFFNTTPGLWLRIQAQYDRGHPKDALTKPCSEC